MSNTQSFSTFFCPTTIHLGSGVTQQIPRLLHELGGKRLFVVVDGALMETPFFAQVQTLINGSKIPWVSFSEVEPDPSVQTVNKAHERLTDHGSDMILAVGGGSTMDVAKAVGILATNGGRIHDYEGIDKFTQAPLPLIAIPSTAGTGSEVSGSCVITDTDNNRKMSIRHARLNPATHALLDPMAVATLPAHVAAHAGIDAFVHAVESYTSRLANLITDAINLEAIGLISQNLRAFVADRGDVNAAQKMLVGSSLTGMVFGQTGLGNVHCMARFVGAQYHLSHGLSNALCLPTVAQFNLSAAKDKYANIGRSLGGATPNEDVNSAAQSAVLAIESLCRDVGIPSGLRDVGANPADFEAMANACAGAGYNRWNPRETSEADFLDLFKRAY
jgi:alcohol dehydrogenase